MIYTYWKLLLNNHRKTHTYKWHGCGLVNCSSAFHMHKTQIDGTIDKISFLWSSKSLHVFFLSLLSCVGVGVTHDLLRMNVFFIKFQLSQTFCRMGIRVKLLRKNTQLYSIRRSVQDDIQSKSTTNGCHTC